MTNKNWHPADVKAALEKKDKNLSQIAKENNLSPSSCTHALKRPVRSANIAISKILNKQLNEIWPEFFDSDGQTIRKCSRASVSRKGKAQKYIEAA